MALTLLVLSCLLGPAGLSQTDQAPTKPKLVEINGKTHPDELPQHLVWRRVFSFLATRDKMPPTGMNTLRHELPVTDKELALIFSVADAHRATDIANTLKHEALLVDLHRTKVPFEQISAKTRNFELDRRAATLKAADDLVDRLTGEGRNALLAWVQDFRKSISVMVPEGDLSFFRLPR